jgi:hypothetical protein
MLTVGAGCIPFYAECCDDDAGLYCESGWTCVDAFTCDIDEDADEDSLHDDDDDNDDDDAGTSISPSLLLVAVGAFFALF